MSQNRNVVSALEIGSLAEQGQIPLLPFEDRDLRRELVGLGEKQAHLGVLLGEARRQSSETWHDNAPADAVNAEGTIVASRAQSIIDALRGALICEYPAGDETTITLGSLVGLRFGNSDELEYYLLTGFSRMAPTFTDGVKTPETFGVATVQSPMGKELLGRKVGDQASYSVNDRQIKFLVGSLVQVQESYIA